MSSYTNQANPYSRQMSDTQFYNNRRRVDETGRHVGQRTTSYSESVPRMRTGSLNNDHKGFREVDKPNSRYHNNVTNGLARGQWSPSLNLKHTVEPDFKTNNRNIVRFHKDIVTDIHDDFSAKIQVDDLESNHSGRSVEQIGYKTEQLELQSPSHIRKDEVPPLHKSRQSSEHGRNNDKSKHSRKESKRTKETNFGVGDDTNVKCNGYNNNSGSSNNARPRSASMSNNKHPLNNEQLANSQNLKDDHKRRTSSKKGMPPSRNSSKIAKVENDLYTKTKVHKTRSSSSTGSSQTGIITKHGNGIVSNGKESKVCLTKTNNNSSSTRKNNNTLSNQFDLKLQFENKNKLARKKKRKTCCVILSLLVTIVIIGAMVTGAVLFFKSKESPKDALDRQRVYDMVNVHVRLRVINRKYTTPYQNVSSSQFNTFSVQMCNEIDVIYITSHMSQNYYGCSVKSLRSGSVRVYYVSPFLDTVDTSNTSLHREILLNNLLTLFSPSRAVNTTALGEFLVDTNSIEISIEKFQTAILPQKPEMPVRVTSTLSPPVSQNVNTKVSSTSSTMSQDTNIATTESSSVGSTKKTKHTTRPLQTTSVQDTPTTTFKKQTVPDIGNSISSTSSFTSTPSTSIDVTTDIDMVYDTSTTSISSTDISSTESIQVKKDGNKTAVDKAKLNETNIRGTGDSVYLLKESATIEFLINNANGLSSLTIMHRNFRKDVLTLKDLLRRELDTRKNLTDTLSSAKTLFIAFGAHSIVVRLNFKTVTCDDVGMYTCIVKTKTGVELKSDCQLNGTAEPGMPQLSLPIALIENTEIKKPIMCTADVGFPNGQLQWKIKPKGSDEFLEFHGHFISQSGHCNNYVTNSLIYTPTKDGNGTLLKCEVVNKYVPHPPDLTAVTDLYILPENMCDGVQINRTIRHPYACTKYIRCLGDSFEVKECENKMCYDEESRRCGQTKLRLTNVIAYLNEGVTSLQCRLDHLGVWNNITISKLDPSRGKEPIVSVFSTSSAGDEIIVYDTDMKDRVFVHKESSQDFEIKINLWLYVLTCADEGEYVCEAFTATDYKQATGRIDLRGKPEAPKISVPNEVIEGMPTRQNVTCQANVGYPEGRLIFKMKLQNETEFHPIRFNVTTEETIQNCSKVLRKSFTFVPALRHEKAELLCEVENQFTLPVNRKLVALEKVHIVPKNFCMTHGSSTPHVHPHDCHQYVQCSQGYTYVQRCGSDHCFNPHTLHCDIEVKDKGQPFDPKHPCLPDKNGVFFHHPILCNKYIWCVQGQEVVHHCPLGTLYIDGGQCTFEPERSRCYNTEAT